MIRYALICELDHEFEAWFSSSGDFDEQCAAALLTCPYCESTDIRKQVMSPAVSGTRNNQSETALELAKAAAKIRENIRKTHDYVGERFADTARAMTTGEEPEKPIYGEVSPKQARELHDEGISAVALPPMLSPGKPKKIN